ncbi:hypothetical protein B0A55_09916 [Friedmanniomyces simplex]|uniref:Uncharacterized protein n=1 Tax=Friedmanniomyces simplex TaxID=329884 RepID=A0A4U0WTR6_9PEZI|nr:hypothetical protein B0A55_09916 [Friedmanniomyces simplex]
MATIAPPKAKATYYNIPPPPLPEFYLPKAPSKGNNDGSSTSSASVDHAQALAQTKIKVRRRSKQKITETYLQEPTTHDYDAALAKLPPDPGDGTDERMRVRYTVERTTSRPIVTFAPPPPPLNTNDVPPLAIYHVCRICLRPRSTRYHCEHPIPINGVPPPPTICRRCRVSTVKEVAKVATVIQESESNKMKLGIGAFIPQEDYVSNKEMKERRARELLRSVERQRLRESSASESTGQEREIAFRRVRVLESVSDSPPRLQTSVKSTAQDAIDAVSVRSQGGRTTIAVAATSRPVGPSSEKTFSVSARPSEGRANDSGFQEVGEGVISTEPPRDIDKTKQKTKITAYTASSIAHAPSTAVARASVSIAQPARPERSESEIRRIAREEIVRYRQAERKMEAHPDPYAHGRMVPVERRIEKQADVIEPMPWARRSEAVEEVVLTRRQKNAKETPTQPAKSSKEDTAKEMAQPRPERVAPRRDEGSKKAPADAELSEPVRPEQGSARIKPDKSVEREYVIERVSKGDSKVSASGWTSGSGWVSEKKDEPGRQSQPSKTTTAKLRSERSERRKWDVMTETPTQQEPSSQTTRSAQDGSRSARSVRRKWDLLTESGKTTTEPRSDRVPNVKQHEVPSWEDERGGYIRREI